MPSEADLGGRTGDPASIAGSILEDETALGRRFNLARRRVDLGERPVELLQPANADDLISEDDFVRDDRLPYWADLWPSAVVLARAIAPRRGEGRRLLELGCGLGLVAIAAVEAGFDVTATDYYDDALRFAEVNVRRATGLSVGTRILDWRAIPEDVGRYDVVVASDVLYEERYPPLVAAALARTLEPGGQALIADPGRVAAPGLPGELAARGLDVVGRDPVAYRDGDVSQTIEVMTIAWR